MRQLRIGVIVDGFMFNKGKMCIVDASLLEAQCFQSSAAGALQVAGAREDVFGVFKFFHEVILNPG